jgi:hypothetical protein
MSERPNLLHEPVAKRARLPEENVANITSSTVNDALTKANVVIQQQQQAAAETEKSKEDPTAVAADVDGNEDDDKTTRCAICFDEAEEGIRVLNPHQCSSCRADSWCVCDECNAALLSRQCPFCKTEYAPKVLHTVAGHALSSVMDPAATAVQKIVTTMKIKMLVEQVFPNCNTLCMLPSGVAMFALKKSEGEAEGKGRGELVLVKTNKLVGTDLGRKCLLPDEGEGESFLFSNAVWDLIEKTSEEGVTDDNSAETLPEKVAAAKVIKASMQPGARLFTPMPCSSWLEMEEEWKEECQSQSQ